MPRPREIDGFSWIKFRTSNKIRNILSEMSKDYGITISELCRNAVLYVVMGYLMGEFKHTFPELREEFIKRFTETTPSAKETVSQSGRQRQSESRRT